MRTGALWENNLSTALVREFWISCSRFIWEFVTCRYYVKLGKVCDEQQRHLISTTIKLCSGSWYREGVHGILAKKIPTASVPYPTSLHAPRLSRRRTRLTVWRKVSAGASAVIACHSYGDDSRVWQRMTCHLRVCRFLSVDFLQQRAVHTEFGAERYGLASVWTSQRFSTTSVCSCGVLRTCAHPRVVWTVLDGCVPYRRLQAWLLQRPSARRTSDDFWQPSASS